MLIRIKLDAYWRRFPVGQRSRDTEAEKHQKEVEGNILIQLRERQTPIAMPVTGA